MKDSIDERRLAIHEASHAVVAKLFSNDLRIKFVTISPEKIKNEAPQLGNAYGLNGVDFVGQDLDWVGFVLFAGIIGERIMKDGPVKVLSNKEAILANPNQLDITLGGGDFEEFEKFANIRLISHGTDRAYLEKHCVSFLIDFLCDEKVWKVVEELAAAVMSKERKTLDADELEGFFHDSSFNEYLRDNKERFLKLSEIKKIDPDSGDEILKRLGYINHDCDMFGLSENKDCQPNQDQ